MSEHIHNWGPIESARFTGNPHRRCLDCRAVTLDLETAPLESLIAELRAYLALSESELDGLGLTRAGVQFQLAQTEDKLADLENPNR
jgi:hypothetical protein